MVGARGCALRDIIEALLVRRVDNLAVLQTLLSILLYFEVLGVVQGLGAQGLNGIAEILAEFLSCLCRRGEVFGGRLSDFRLRGLDYSWRNLGLDDHFQLTRTSAAPCGKGGAVGGGQRRSFKG